MSRPVTASQYLMASILNLLGVIAATSIKPLPEGDRTVGVALVFMFWIMGLLAVRAGSVD